MREMVVQFAGGQGSSGAPYWPLPFHFKQGWDSQSRPY